MANRILPTSSRIMLAIAADKNIPTDFIRSQIDLERAARHGLLGLMALSTNPALRQLALPAYSRLLARQEVMQSHLRRVLTELHNASIPATVLKGPHLASWAYREPGHRTFTDIDLLVQTHDVGKTLQILEEDHSVPSIPPKGPKADKRNIPIGDESGVRFTLDLHWDLFSYTQLRGCATGATQQAWKDAQFLADHPLGPLWELPLESRFAFLCTHAVLDHRFRLILFRDLAEAVKRGIDWSAVVRFAEIWKLRSTTYAALFIAKDFLDLDVDSQVMKALRPRSNAVRAIERLLPTVDLVEFDGHRPHPLNLAMVLLHDDLSTRLRLLSGAPLAFPGWRQRTATTGARRSSTRKMPSVRLEPVSSHADPAPALPKGRQAEPLILHVLPVDLARGAQMYAAALSRSLDGALGAHRTVVLFESQPAVLHADVELGAKSGLWRQQGLSVFAGIRLRRMLKQLRPELIVAHGGESLKYAALFAPRSVPLVYYKIGTSRDRLSSPLRRFGYRAFARRASLVAGVSREMVEEAQDVLLVKPDRARYIPNGRDPALFEPWVGAPMGAPVRFVFVGQITRTKRPELFVRMIKTLVTAGVRVDGVMIGDGPMMTQIRRLAMGLPIDLLGSRNDVPQILSRTDVFAFTSMVEGEGMPGVLIEAGLAGLPVLTTKVPGAGTVVEDGITGYVVDVDDTKALIDAALRLALDPELRRKMGSAGLNRCRSEFTLDESVELWRDAISRLIPHAAVDPPK